MAEEVDHEFGLHQEFVPQEHQEAGVNTCKDGKEMCFEGADGTLGCIAAVDVRGNQLVGGVPVFFDDVANSWLVLLSRMLQSMGRPRFCRWEWMLL